jgi:uncharacterized membrane protein
MYLLNQNTVLWGIWNLFLAIIPVVASFFLAKRFDFSQKKFKQGHSKLTHYGVIAFVFLLWFFFFPNIAYLILDVRHLMSACVPSSLNRCFNAPEVIMLLFVFGAISIPLMVISLEQIRRITAAIFTEFISNVLLVGYLFVASIGLHLGLLSRFNSWNLVTHPWWILSETWLIITTPKDIMTLIGFTLSQLVIFWGFRAFVLIYQRLFQSQI